MRQQEHEVNGQVSEDLNMVAQVTKLPKAEVKNLREGGKLEGQVTPVNLKEEEYEALEEAVGEETTADTVNASEIDITPEEMASTLPKFEDIEELKEFVKDFNTHDLEYMAKALKLEWKPTDHPAIHRMRIAMALQAHFFPELFKPKDEKKKKAKYGDFDTATLSKMCKDNKVKWEKSNNESINRMRMIMALKASGHIAE